MGRVFGRVMLSHLAHWTAPPTSLRITGRDTAPADARQEPEDWRPASEHWIGGATERDDGDDTRPGERVPVYALNRQARILGELVLTTRSLACEAAALSFMTAGPHDVRPQILLALYGQDARALLACVGYGVRYLSAWCEINGEPRSRDAIHAAAADALEVIYRRRAPMAADDRAKTLGLRAASFRQLRTLALRVYRRRLQEACVAYHTGRIHTRESPYSRVGRSSPPCIASSSRATPRNEWQQNSPAGSPHWRWGLLATPEPVSAG